MSDDLRDALQAAYRDVEAAERTRDETQRRVLFDPIGHAVLEMVKRVIVDLDGPEPRQPVTVAFDAVAAILSLIDPAEARGYDRAIANLRTADTSGWPGGRGWEVEGCLEAAIRHLEHTRDSAP